MSNDSYQALARLYDPATGPFLAPVRRLVREELRRLGARLVLDVCCGTGRQVALLRAGGMAAVGLDASPAMLGRARGLPVARMDARVMAVPDAAFDATLICLALHENRQDDRLAMLAEMARVTRPGGHLLVVDYRTPYPVTVMGPLVSLAECLAGREHYRNYRDFLARKGVLGLVRQSGLTVGRTVPCLGGRAALVVSPAPRPCSARSGPARPETGAPA